MEKLRIKNISKHFGTTKAVDDCSIDVHDGELLAVLGPSGCGKSTLLASIAGVENADRGEIILGGRCIYSKERKINLAPDQRNIGFVFQNYALWPHMTVFDNIAFPLKMRRKPKAYIRKEVGRVLELIRLESKAFGHPRELSGGEQQRVALGRALVMNPDLLLLDEPLSNLDARLRENMQLEIRKIQQEMYLTVVHVTHDQAEAMAMADRIAVMHEGRILQTGRPQEVYEKPATEFVAEFVGTNNLIWGPAVRDLKAAFPKEYEAAGSGGRLGTGEVPQGRTAFVVRPEEITLIKTGDFARGTAGTGTITNKVYRGAHIMYEIRCVDRVLRAQLHPGAAFNVGETVGVRFHKTVPIVGGELERK